MSKKILIVEDEDTQRNMLKIALQKAGYATDTARDGEEALEKLLSPEQGDIDLVLLDLVLGALGGMDVLRKVHDHNPELPIIVLTAHSSVDKAVEAMRSGAVDFIAKPAGVERLKVSIDNALKINMLTGEVSRLNRRENGATSFEDIIGQSAVMKSTIELAKKGAVANIPILLEGESGVGKEVFAKAIQSASERAKAPFVVVNCGALPHNLIESTLFGHEEGAFTGATEARQGKFVDASGGTIFLDEIGELPLEAQSKLLRVLQEGEVEPIGSRETVHVDVRVISATNKKLTTQIQDGSFREDLFYRLNVFPVLLPALRDRKGDIELLARHFMHNITVSEGQLDKEISGAALEVLKQYHWPGNVRQFENAMFRAVILSDNDVIGPQDFPQILKALDQQGGDGAGSFENDPFVSSEHHIAERHGKIIHITDTGGKLRQISDLEREIIEYAVEKYDGRMSKIARHLGIGRSTLYRKVAELGLVENQS